MVDCGGMTMGQCEAQIFNGITVEQFEKLQDKAKSAGIPLDGPSGEATKMGILFGWNYEAAEARLTIQCLQVPFFVSCSDVNTRISSLVKETLADGQ
jgi:hypothetical protein